MKINIANNQQIMKDNIQYNEKEFEIFNNKLI